MTIRERSIKYHPINYKSGTKRLSNQLLHSVAYCSTTRYSIILAGNLKEYGECYSGAKTLYSSAYKRHGINVISKHISINSLRRVI